MKLTRRQLNELLIATPALLAAAVNVNASPGPTNTVSKLIIPGPSVKVSEGHYTGYIKNGIHTFKGIPYAAPLTAESRFGDAKEPNNFAEARPAIVYGPSCPQAEREDWKYKRIAFLFDWDEGYQQEDCLNLNIWTPSLSTDRRPVMVWIHGGNFEAGSSHELPAYDGEQLSRSGDVVIVSINHRIGVLGHLNVQELLGDQYEQSANVGMTDLVLALRWISNNIQNFGGDSNNITLFGQSGGGFKISTLMSMPSAKGLFHKAIIQSGSREHLGTPADSRIVSQAVFDALNLTRSNATTLLKIPVRELIQAGKMAQQTLTQGTPREIKERYRWQPMVDGELILGHPLEKKAFQISDTIPLLLGTTQHEWNPATGDARMASMGWQGVEDYLKPRYGNNTAGLVAQYVKSNPNARPIEVLSLILSPRTSVVKQANAKYSSGSAPVYMYWFGWCPPLFEGAPLAYHGIELPFVFDNIDRAINMTGGGAEANSLAARTSMAWVAFARHGHPSYPGIPYWNAYTPSKGETMIIDRLFELKDDPDREGRLALEKANRSTH